MSGGDGPVPRNTASWLLPGSQRPHRTHEARVPFLAELCFLFSAGPGCQGDRPPLTAPWSGNLARHSRSRPTPPATRVPRTRPRPGGTYVLHTAMVWHASPVQNSEMVLYCRLTWWKNVVAATEKGQVWPPPRTQPAPGGWRSGPEPWGGPTFRRPETKALVHGMGLGCWPAAPAQRVGHTARPSERPGPRSYQHQLGPGRPWAACLEPAPLEEPAPCGALPPEQATWCGTPSPWPARWAG